MNWLPSHARGGRRALHTASESNRSCRFDFPHASTDRHSRKRLWEAIIWGVQRSAGSRVRHRNDPPGRSPSAVWRRALLHEAAPHSRIFAACQAMPAGMPARTGMPAKIAVSLERQPPAPPLPHDRAPEIRLRTHHADDARRAVDHRLIERRSRLRGLMRPSRKRLFQYALSCSAWMRARGKLRPSLSGNLTQDLLHDGATCGTPPAVPAEPSSSGMPACRAASASSAGLV